MAEAFEAELRITGIDDAVSQINEMSSALDQNIDQVDQAGRSYSAAAESMNRVGAQAGNAKSKLEEQARALEHISSRSQQYATAQRNVESQTNNVVRSQQQQIAKLAILNNAVAQISTNFGRLDPKLATIAQGLAAGASTAVAFGSAFGPLGVAVSVVVGALPSFIRLLSDADNEMQDMARDTRDASQALQTYTQRFREQQQAQQAAARVAAGTESPEEARTRAEQAHGLILQRRDELRALAEEMDATGIAQRRLLQIAEGSYDIPTEIQRLSASIEDIGRVGSSEYEENATRLRRAVEELRSADRQARELDARAQQLATDAQRSSSANAVGTSVMTRDDAERRRAEAEAARRAAEAARAAQAEALRLRQLWSGINEQMQRGAANFSDLAASNADQGVEIAQLKYEQLQQELEMQQKLKAIEGERLEQDQEKADSLERYNERLAYGEEAAQGFVSVFTEAIKARHDGEVKFGKAIKLTLKEWLGAFARKEALLGASDLAQAIAKTFSAPQEAATLYISGAEHIALAAAAGGGAAAIPGGGSGGGGGSARPEPSAGTSGGQGGGTVVINVNTPTPEADIGRTINDASRAARARDGSGRGL